MIVLRIHKRQSHPSFYIIIITTVQKNILDISDSKYQNKSQKQTHMHARFARTHAHTPPHTRTHAHIRSNTHTNTQRHTHAHVPTHADAYTRTQ